MMRLLIAAIGLLIVFACGQQNTYLPLPVGEVGSYNENQGLREVGSRLAVNGYINRENSKIYVSFQGVMMELEINNSDVLRCLEGYNGNAIMALGEYSSDMKLTNIVAVSVYEDDHNGYPVRIRECTANSRE